MNRKRRGREGGGKGGNRGKVMVLLEGELQNKDGIRDGATFTDNFMRQLS